MSPGQTLFELAKKHGAAADDHLREQLSTDSMPTYLALDAIQSAKGLNEEGFARDLAECCGITWWKEPLVQAPRELLREVSARVALRHQILPIEKNESGMTLLIANPFDLLGRQRIAACVKGPHRYAMVDRHHLREALRASYGIGAETFEAIIAGRVDDSAFDEFHEEASNLDEEDNAEASVVTFVNNILREAIRTGATDIHVEPLDDDLRIRFRIDGVLHPIPVPPNIKVLQESVLSRLKIMAHLDIAERRLPQDGRISMDTGGQRIDVRVAVIPTVTGETVSLRLLPDRKYDMAGLGLGPVEEAKMRELLALPNGVVLVTGPTGSGKSTTLYVLLSCLNDPERRIVTIEDPVEGKLPGVNQIAVRPDIGLTFAAGLRSILRADPNVIMVGEMRDLETAETAIRAALTGHLVFSTLHTNDAVGSVTRLIDMGVPPFLVSAAVRAFAAQRLVRRLCRSCRKEAPPDQAALKSQGLTAPPGARIWKAAGCPSCQQTGYQGRVAIMEICSVTQKMQEMISRGASYSDLHQQALQDGMKTLRQVGFEKVLEGITTLEELERVTAVEEVASK